MKARDIIRNMDGHTQERLRSFKESLRTKELVAAFQNCNACGVTLEFSYKKDTAKGLIMEEACCRLCHGVVSPRTYKIC